MKNSYQKNSAWWVPHKEFYKFFSFWILILATAGIAKTQGVDDEKDLAVDTSVVVSIDSEEDWDLFGNQDILRLSLQFNLKEYQKYTQEPVYQDAVLTIYSGDKSVEKTVRIKPRGQFRRKYCSFPPLKLNIKKTEFDNEYLKKQTTFKFVTHCKYSNEYESNLLKEYLVYKLFNQLTDMSFKVRLVQMEYIDTGKKNKVFNKYGFLIEHINSVAERNNAFVMKNEKLGQSVMEKNHLALVALFEYMIGNVDWSITGLHNMKILKIYDHTLPDPIPVPYDFDYSGIIDAEYAIPNAKLEIASVRERLYRGICLPEEAILEAKEVLIANRDAFIKIIEDFEYLDKKVKQKMIYYLESFYPIVENERSFKREIIDACVN